MEYFVGLERRRIIVEWNGSEVGLVRTTLARHISRSVQYKVQLYLPRMPNNHVFCMKRLGPGSSRQTETDSANIQRENLQESSIADDISSKIPITDSSLIQMFIS